MHFSWIECFVKICLVWSGFVELCKYQFHKLKRFVSQLVFTAAVCSVFNHLSIFCFTLTHKYLFSLLFSKRNTMLLRIKMFLCYMQWGFEKMGMKNSKVSVEQKELLNTLNSITQTRTHIFAPTKSYRSSSLHTTVI